MSEIILSGVVTAVLQQQQGVSRRTQQPWVSQEYVLCHEQGQYPRSVCFKVFGLEKIQQMAQQENIDAFFLTVDLINDMEYLMPLLSYFYDRQIPVYLMDDVSVVEAGALMLISANDMENIGRFIADVIAKTLNGAEAGSLPCVYTSAPSIYVNYDIANRINYQLSFKFLAACDQIFTAEGKKS